MAKESKSNFQSHVLLDSVRGEVKKVIDHWAAKKKDINSEPSAYGVPSLSKNDFDQYLSSLSLLLNSEAAAATFNPVATSHLIRTSSLINHVNAMVGQINNVVSSPGHWPSLCDHAYTLSNYLQICLFGGSGWVNNSNVTREAIGLFGQSKNMYEEAQKLVLEAKVSKDESDKYRLKAKELIEASTETEDKIKDEIDKLEKYKEGINQRGLANSFASQVASLKKSSSYWSILFILTLALFAVISLSPVIKDVLSWSKSSAPSLNFGQNEHSVAGDEKSMIKSSQQKVEEPKVQITSQHQNDALQILITTLYRILMCSPLIWLAWFSGRQFNANKRLISEYSYKEAVAKAYYGYKQEAKGIPELEAKLLEGAIAAFNKNPSDEMSNPHAVSPYEELFSMIFKGEKAETVMGKFADLVKAAKGK